ncbi:hypothetical protein Tco_1375595 [Tanacetum coccineum]
MKALTFHQKEQYEAYLNQSDQDSLNSAANGNFLIKNTQEALTIVKNKSKFQTSRNKPQVSSASGSSTQDAHVTALTKQVKALLFAMNRLTNYIQNGCETCGGPHAYYECQATSGYTQEDVYATTGTYNVGGNSYQPQGFLLVSPPKQKEDPKPNPHQPKIPYPLRLNKIKLLDKNDVQVSKFLKILKQLHFDISLMDALTQIPKYHKVLKDLLKDKKKLAELTNTLINVECSAILLNKVPKKLDDPGKFLIPCILQDLEVCNSLANSRASINLMPLSIYEKLGIRALKPT